MLFFLFLYDENNKIIFQMNRFLNVISASAPKENSTLQVTKITQSKEVLTLQESALSASPGSTLVCFISNSSSTVSLFDASRVESDKNSPRTTRALFTASVCGRELLAQIDILS